MLWEVGFDLKLGDFFNIRRAFRCGVVKRKFYVYFKKLFGVLGIRVCSVGFVSFMF